MAKISPLKLITLLSFWAITLWSQEPGTGLNLSLSTDPSPLIGQDSTNNLTGTLYPSFSRTGHYFGANPILPIFKSCELTYGYRRLHRNSEWRTSLTYLGSIPIKIPFSLLLLKWKVTAFGISESFRKYHRIPVKGNFEGVGAGLLFIRGDKFGWHNVWNSYSYGSERFRWLHAYLFLEEGVSFSISPNWQASFSCAICPGFIFEKNEQSEWNLIEKMFWLPTLTFSLGKTWH